MESYRLSGLQLLGCWSINPEYIKKVREFAASDLCQKALAQGWCISDETHMLTLEKQKGDYLYWISPENCETDEFDFSLVFITKNHLDLSLRKTEVLATHTTLDRAMLYCQ